VDLPEEPFSVDFFSSPNVFVTCVLSQQLFYYSFVNKHHLLVEMSLHCSGFQSCHPVRFSHTVRAVWASCGLAARAFQHAVRVPHSTSCAAVPALRCTPASCCHTDGLGHTFVLRF